MQAHQISVPKTAHYYTIGTPGPHVRHFWIACHGYGQAAGDLIYKFEGLDNGETFVVAPEGLSRFYFNGLTGRVGASWMTKKDRLVEIDDYTNYLQLIYDTFVPQLHESVKITLFGFSQGGTTHSRWIMAKRPHFHNFILWGAIVADDLDYRPAASYFADKQLFHVYGLQDQFLTPERLEQYEQFCREQGLNYETITFEGKHVVDRKLLNQLATRLSD